MKTIEYWEKLLRQFQDDVLDEYNNRHISKKEMLNIMKWANKIIEIKKKRPGSKDITFFIEPKD